MEEYKNDLLKYFIQYNNTNSEVILDVSQDKCSSKFMEQLKSLINLLLHFRYMLSFAKKHGLTACGDGSNNLEYKLKAMAEELFAADFDFCSEQYAHLINSNIFFDFIRKREQFYLENMDSYHSFKRELTESYQGSMNDATMVDDIITVPDLHLVDNGGHGHHSQQQSGQHTANSQDYATGGQLTGANQSSHHPQQQFDIALQLSNQTAGFEDQNNKDLYANLLDLLPRPSASVSGVPNNTGGFDSTQAVFPGSSSSNQSLPSKLVKSPRGQKRPAKSPVRSAVEPSSHNVSYGAKTDDAWKVMEYQTPELLQVEYWCSYEGCRFRSKSLLQVKAHEERRHVQQIQKCSFDGCGETFTSRDDLDSHVAQTHLVAKVKCTVVECDQEFINEHRLKLHIKEKHQEAYLTCQFCAKKFKTRRYLSKHVRRMHSARKKSIKKKPKQTTEKKKEKKEGDEEGENATGSDPAEDTDDDTEEDEEEGEEEEDPEEDDGASSEAKDSKEATAADTRSFECNLDGCKKRFPKKGKLKQHIREEHTEDYLTCKFCDKLCRTRNNLTNHIWIMHEEGEFKCTFENCDFISKYRKNLLNHKKLRHQRVRKCPIDGCGQMVPITRYQRHMSSLHKIKNYGCSWPDCGKSFADHNALKNHVRIHLNFKRYKCKWPECGYASEQRFTVITHIRVCHFKLPRTKKRQLELNISQDSLQNPYDYLEVCREDICI